LYDLAGLKFWEIIELPIFLSALTAYIAPVLGFKKKHDQVK
jgi:hypothetical protein